MLLLDGTPAVGYRGFLNFMAAWQPDALAAIDDTLTRAPAHAAATCRTPPATLTAVHQPLSVTQTLGRVNAGAGAALTATLARHGVAAVVSGHLHDVGGLRQHACHAAPAAACAARSAGAGAACCVLELEAPGWKALSRHFRITSFAGGHFAFTDLSFEVRRDAAPAVAPDPSMQRSTGPLLDQLPANFSADCSMRPMDPTALSTPYVVHIAAPPDARYFPSAATLQPWELSEVEVYLLWSHTAHARGAAVYQLPPRPPHRVTASISCRASAGAHPADWASSFDLTADTAQHPARASAAVPRHTLERARACAAAGGSLTLQVFAAHETLGTAHSELRPIAAAAAAAVPQQAMQVSLLEWLAVRPRWPTVLLCVFEGMVAMHALLLVASWLARDRLGCGGGARPSPTHHAHAIALYRASP